MTPATEVDSGPTVESAAEAGLNGSLPGWGLAGPVAQATSRNTAVGILLATALGGGSSGSAERAPAAIPAPGLGWTLVWSDEFEGPSSALVDAAKWAFDLGGGGWGNQELETYTDRPRNASLTGEGTLAIQALGETFTGADGITREYTSARLKTQGKFDKAYSRCEARLRVPRGQGLWPAFWMLGADIGTVGWPRCGEIDVMESSMAMVSAEGSTPTSSIARRQRAYVTQRLRPQAQVDLQTMGERRLETTWSQRFFGKAMGVFAAVALLLACLGVYGVLSYAVARRRREIGVRMALGATAADVLRLVLGEAARLAALGVGLGLLLAAALARSLHGILYGVSASDPWALLGMAAALMVVMIAASALPARGAARTDPLESLRQE